MQLRAQALESPKKTEVANLLNQKLVARSEKEPQFYNVDELIDKYCDAHTRLNRVQSKTSAQIYADLKQVADLMQAYQLYDLNEIDREGAELIRELLCYLPKNVNKHPCFFGLNPIEVIEANQTLKLPLQSRVTVNKKLQLFSTFCNWCLSHDYIEKNYFKSISFPRCSYEERQKFSEDQLKQIFQIPQYLEHKYLHPYYYWLPLLLRYTGCRLNELCQLRREDIKEENGIYYLDINEQGERLVKAQASIRFVPLHDELLAKGFICFAKQSSGRLFPELKLINGYASHAASNWFYRVRSKLGFGKGLDAHSFRHTLINELKQNEVAMPLVEEINGHSHRSESYDTYANQYNLKLKKAAIDKICSKATGHIKGYYE